MSDDAPGADLVVAEDHFLGDAAAHRDGEIGVHLVAVIGVIVALGQAHDHAQRAAARDDRRLVDRIGRRLVDRDDGVAGLVIGGHPLLVLGHHHRLALGAHHDLVLGFLELAHRDEALAAAGGEQRGFVDEVGEIGAGEAGRAARNDARIDVGRQRHLLHVDGEDLLAALDVGARHDDLAVEAARAQQRRIEHVGAVGRGDDDDAFVGLEAVHLDEQLVERLLALVIAVAEAGAAMAADGVDLVDEDDARRDFLAWSNMSRTRLAPTPTNISTKSEPEMVKNGTPASPAMARASSVLPVPGEPTSSAPLGILPPSRANLLGSFRNSTISCSSSRASSMPATSSKVTRPSFCGQHAGAALAEAHRAGAGILLHLAHDEEADAEDQQERQRLVEEDQPERRLLGFLGLDLDVAPWISRSVTWASAGRECAEPSPLASLPVMTWLPVALVEVVTDLTVALVDLRTNSE